MRRGTLATRRACASSGEGHMAGFEFWWITCNARRPLPVVGVVISSHTLRVLAVIWLHPTRLEARIKESNRCASL